VTLVEAPGFFHRDPEFVEFVEHDPERAQRAFEHRAVGQIEGVAFFFEDFARRLGFLAALVGQIHIGPSGEPVFLVPRAFAVPEQYEFVHKTFPCRAARGL
jgi:hypothetical protein